MKTPRHVEPHRQALIRTLIAADIPVDTLDICITQIDRMLDAALHPPLYGSGPNGEVMRFIPVREIGR